MHRRLVISSFGVVLLAALGIASAQNAYTARPMNLRAGPNRAYPVVAQVDAGAPLDVHGCLDGWSWCDVSFEDSRGWMYGGGISFAYNGEESRSTPTDRSWVYRSSRSRWARTGASTTRAVRGTGSATRGSIAAFPHPEGW